jgi:hypothetical protein
MMRAFLPRLVGCSIVGAIAVLSQVATAQCPVGSKITIDYDIPGSGYSETSNNWTTWNTSPCNGAGYRYLSHTVGDGSRKGKAIWKPAIVTKGHYRVTTGYRATENRSSDADYFAYDDLGAVVHKVVNQREGSNCQWVEMGTFFCQPGGTCRVELDGTDDSQSDCADVTIYELLDCGGGTGGTGGSGGTDAGPVAGRCDSIRANAAWEVCEETSTTCKGVFTDGAGCVVYCAAAGMTCTARFGGEPGCQKEPQNVLGCGDNNGHLSDWCECEGPPIEPDAGQGGSGGGLPDASAGSAGGPAGTGGGTASDSAASDSAYDGAWGGSSGSGGSESPDAAKPPGGIATGGDDGGCGCRLKPSRSPQSWILALLGIVLVGRARKPLAQGPKETQRFT